MKNSKNKRRILKFLVGVFIYNMLIIQPQNASALQNNYNEIYLDKGIGTITEDYSISNYEDSSKESNEDINIMEERRSRKEAELKFQEEFINNNKYSFNDIENISENIIKRSNSIKTVKTYEEFIDEIKNGTSTTIELGNDISTDEVSEIVINRELTINGKGNNINFKNNIPMIDINSSNVTIKNLNINGKQINEYSVMFMWKGGRTLSNITLEDITIYTEIENYNANIVTAWSGVENLTINNVEYIGAPITKWNNIFELEGVNNLTLKTNIKNPSAYGGKVYLRNPKGKIDIKFTGSEYENISELLTIENDKKELFGNSDDIIVKIDKNILRKEYFLSDEIEIYSYAIKGEDDDSIKLAEEEVKKLYNIFNKNKTKESFWGYAKAADETEDRVRGSKYVYTSAEREKMNSAYRRYDGNYFFKSPWSNSNLWKQLAEVKNTHCIIYQTGNYLDKKELQALVDNNNTITMLINYDSRFYMTIKDIGVFKHALSTDGNLFYNVGQSSTSDKGSIYVSFRSIDKEIIRKNNWKFDLEIMGFYYLKGRSVSLYGIDENDTEVNLGKVTISDTGSLKLTYDGKYKEYKLQEDANVSTISYRNSQAIKYSENWTRGQEGQFTYKDKETIEYTFYGTGIRWNAFTDSLSGKAKITLDGEELGIFDLKSNRDIYVNERGINVIFYKYGLKEGIHNIKIETIIDENININGNKEYISSRGFDIILEGNNAFTRIEEDDENIIKTGNWKKIENGYYDDYSNGAMIISNTKGDKLEYNFEGTAIRLLGVYDEYGYAKVTIDGESEIIDLYESYMAWNESNCQSIIYEKLNLSPGKHNITIEVLGEKIGFSYGTDVILDAIEIIGKSIKPIVKDGWKKENDSWYYYNDGKQLIGWQSIAGSMVLL